jgi:hypothetical protein
MRFDENMWERWRHWVQKIKEDLEDTVNDHAVFRSFQRLCAENEAWIDEHEGHLFCSLVFRCYGARALLGVRRHLKSDSDSISFVRLAEQVQRCGPQITFAFYLSRFPLDPSYVSWQAPAFRLLSEDGETVSPAIISRDLDEFKALNRNIEQFTDRTLAHLDKRGSQTGVQLEELGISIAKFNELLCRYICFLTGDGYISLEATILSSWRRIFEVPLRRPAYPRPGADAVNRAAQLDSLDGPSAHPMLALSLPYNL